MQIAIENSAPDHPNAAVVPSVLQPHPPLSGALAAASSHRPVVESQVNPATQSSVDAHVDKHALPAHFSGEQSLVLPSGLPTVWLPSHFAPKTH